MLVPSVDRINKILEVAEKAQATFIPYEKQSPVEKIVNENHA